MHYVAGGACFPLTCLRRLACIDLQLSPDWPVRGQFKLITTIRATRNMRATTTTAFAATASTTSTSSRHRDVFATVVAPSAPSDLVRLNANQFGAITPTLPSAMRISYTYLAPGDQHEFALQRWGSRSCCLAVAVAPRLLTNAHWCTAPASSVEDKGASGHDYFAHYFPLALPNYFWRL